MNKAILGISAAFSVILANGTLPVALACTLDGKEGIAPHNDLYIPATSFAAATGITSKAFSATNAKMTRLYKPVFASLGRAYRVVANWDDGEVNAYAMRNGKASEVYMFGGLARHPKMTPDGYVLVICHETGHHLAGSPLSVLSNGKLDPTMAIEGQADYYATFACARKVWADEDNARIVSSLKVPADVVKKCQSSFDSSNEIALCERSALAGKDLGSTLADLNGTALPDFSTPDRRVAPNSKYPNWDNKDPAMRKEVHPPAQCRLDTYYAGAICERKAVDILSATDALFAVCTQEKGDIAGVRPVCWYKPGQSSKLEKFDDSPSNLLGSVLPIVPFGPVAQVRR